MYICESITTVKIKKQTYTTLNFLCHFIALSLPPIATDLLSVIIDQFAFSEFYINAVVQDVLFA